MQTVVAGRTAGFLSKVFGGKETEHTKAVVDGDKHHTFKRKEVAIMSRLIASAARKAAAVDPEHDGQFTVFAGSCRRVHIQVKAVFAGAVILKYHVIKNVVLGTVRPIFGGVPLT